MKKLIYNPSQDHNACPAQRPQRVRALNLIKRVKRQLQAAFGTKPSPLQFANDHPFIFIHINKTGGTSVGNAIGLSVKSHQTAKEIIQRIGKDQWDSAYKFTFVRNPWDRMVSLYEYRLRKNKTRLAQHNLGFEQWVKKTIGNEQDPFYYNNPMSFQPQVEWLKDQQGKISIDFIGRFERFSVDFDKICKTLGLETQLPHLNASSHAPYQTYYSDECRAVVARWFHEDIQRFDYRFES